MKRLLLTIREAFFYYRIFIKIKPCLRRGIYHFDGLCFKKHVSKQTGLLNKILFFKVTGSKLPNKYQLDEITLVRISFSSNKIVCYNRFYYNFVKKIDYFSVSNLPYFLPSIKYKNKWLYIQKEIYTSDDIQKDICSFRRSTLTFTFATSKPRYVCKIENILCTEQGFIKCAFQHGDYNEPNFIIGSLEKDSNQPTHTQYVIDYDFTGVYPILYDYFSILFLNEGYKINIKLFIEGYYDYEIKETLNNTYVEDKYLLISIFLLTRYFTTLKYHQKTLKTYICSYIKDFIRFLDENNIYIRRMKRFFFYQKIIK